MCPLIDLINHHWDQSKVRFYAAPAKLHVNMLDLELRKCIQDDIERESYDHARGFKQEIEDGTLC